MKRQQDVELSIEEQYKQQIAELEAKLAEEENRFLRLRADYDNLRRRTQLDREAAGKISSTKFTNGFITSIR